ncbi:MAG: T9SS type A sorting domain-containing protein, partial [candidate division WOR-3 bacterium]|nr:T9SS type A sorting domain-containing protein [candidate division WOR-3 bacterium]
TSTTAPPVLFWFAPNGSAWAMNLPKIASGATDYGVAIGDVNNDGLLDVGYGMHHNYANNDFGDSIMEVALGDGTGRNWIPWDDGISIGDASPWGMFCTDFADIDNDGDLDLGGNSFGADDGIHIFINRRDGTWYQSFGFIGGNSTMDFMFGDVNNDGYADFCAAHQYGSIYLGNGAGGFTNADGNLPPGGSSGRRGPSLGDVDNDGDLDFSYCNTNGGVEVWRWQGNNTWVSYSTGLPTTGPYDLTQLFDMNLDGYIDLCAFGDSTVTVWRNTGTGWIQDTTFRTPRPGRPSAFRTGADADHNGYPDILIVGDEGDSWNSRNRPRFYKESSTPQDLFIYPVFPRGREKFYRGSVQFLKWTCGDLSRTAIIKLELSTNGPSGPWTLIASNLKNNCRYQWRIPPNIQGSDNCYIRFTAITASDTATAINPLPFSILPIIGIEEATKKNRNRVDFNVAPNPARNLINIKIATEAGRSVVRVYDSNGRLIKELFKINGAGEFNIYWNFRDQIGRPVPSGEYFIKLESEKGTIEKKIVITH